MTNEEKQAWELENGKVWTDSVYDNLLISLNLTPIYEADNGNSKIDG